jgi:hypothetical protein
MRTEASSKEDGSDTRLDAIWNLIGSWPVDLGRAVAYDATVDYASGNENTRADLTARAFDHPVSDWAVRLLL